MTVFPGAYSLPGMRAADFTREAAITWGKEEQRVTMDAVIAAATVWNNGATDETNLPGGLLLGGPVFGKLMQWDPTSVLGYEKLFGVLMNDQRMLNAAGTAADRFLAPILVGGRVKPSQLYISGYSKATSMTGALELMARAALSQTGRFIMDDDLAGNPFGGLVRATTKATDYTVLESDNNTLFKNLGAVVRVRFTLPAPRLGFRAVFYDMVGTGIDLVAASGTPLVGLGDATRDEINMPAIIGSYCELIGISATQYLVIVTPGGEPAESLSSGRMTLHWRPLENAGKPCIAGDIAYQYDMAMGVAGTSMTTALCTVPTTGGVLLTTAGAANDQAILQPHATAAYSAWRDTNFIPSAAPTWECKIKTGASVTNYLLKAGLCLTNANDVGTDADQVAFFYDDDDGVNPLLLQVITSIANVDVAVSTGITLALSTIYHLKIVIDAGRVARCYVNGDLVVTTGALTAGAALKPFISIDNEGGGGAAKAITVYGEDASLAVA